MSSKQCASSNSLPTSSVIKLKETAGNLAQIVSKKRNMIISMIIVMAVLIGITYYVYINFIEPLITTSNDLTGNGGTAEPIEKNSVIVYFFHAKWCPFSKKAEPIFDSVIEEWKKKNDTNNLTLISEKYEENDMTENKSISKIMEFESKYLDEGKNIEGYPSIFAVKNINDENEVVEFDAKINKEYLNEFIKQIMK